ncbi:MAG: hypothetical protein GX654_16725 [Desulfatiglans sp.]|nr:hypothetical protein [Desulfatiglans sp.]
MLFEKIGFAPSEEGKYIASIDFGSHTARFLLGQTCAPPEFFRHVVRKRVYTNLAEGFPRDGAGVINEKAMERAVHAITHFTSIAHGYPISYIAGAATGIMRRAENGLELLERIKERTGVDINVIKGEDEAALTLMGISHALKLNGSPDAFFDLGGATTEIIIYSRGHKKVYSFPLGAFVLTEQYLKHDPPLEEEINKLKLYVDSIILDNVSSLKKTGADILLIGSGGTVTSLMALALDIDEEEVSPDRINGAILEMDMVKSIYSMVRPMSITERLRIKGIDEGRAAVILSGVIAVMSIMEFFNSDSLTVSYSDILEGLIISHLKGAKR